MITLEPLTPAHVDALWPAADDDAIRRFWPLRWESREDVLAQIESLWERPDAEPFLIRDDGAVAGSTAAYDMRADQWTIGYTFLLRGHRGTGVNQESKLWMLRRAFRAGVSRVHFHVDARNERSQRAMAKIAVHVETRSRDRECHDGYVRDTTIWEITAADWPAVEARLTG